MNSSSRILLHLVNDMLDFFQIKNGKFHKNEQRVNVREGIRHLLDIFQVAIEEKGLQLLFVCKQSVPEEVVVDEQRMY